jgi:hypothetical protein
MKITLEDLKASYRNMSDEELLSLDRAELTEMAQKAYDGEMERRGLQAEAEEEGEAVSTPAVRAAGASTEPLVAVRTCRSADEAWSVVSALESAGIPARIGDESTRAASWLGTGIGQYPVAVPASRAEEARDFLNAETPDAIIVTARYENGVFKPLEEVEIAEGTVVEIHVPSEAFGTEN